ncbi:Methyl-accepting chemotaxis protein 2 [Pirellula sp. SH-Sr6A]|uniref:methyl-accepting chemotaxis protein n=1 Tax=Pirellula sp. SH-Sr6A TaxID=1632865 RepID=UPI00078CD7D2|nr:methyl-accepting chemotaxis protein [Pirellula sp. SH-Sr6A]AMV31441.1 Methyl-accepting chemotaxis protein 2 [Pirellula sp. SH-Sr6A]
MPEQQDDKFSPELVAGLTTTLDSVMDRTINAIDKVNDQIRVLALNARIEAARAGDAGKAFNIVAMEIAGLSNSSTEVVANLKRRSRKTLSRISKISEDMGKSFKGVRLSDLARMNIDLVDRCLYERSCDVRWWATDASVVDALTDKNAKSSEFACQRLRTILDSYTVYSDLVLCEPNGQVIACGRPEMFRSIGTEQSSTVWFQSALQSRSGREYGFQTVHPCAIVNNRHSVVFSAAVREDGAVDGRVIGVLGIIFNWDNFARDIVNNVALSSEEKQSTRVCIVDPTGLVLADSQGRTLQESIEFSSRGKLFAGKKGYVIAEVGDSKCCIGHAQSAGFETYASGWHSVLIQEIENDPPREGDSLRKRTRRRSIEKVRRPVAN